jgi:hypothetical protein
MRAEMKHSDLVIRAERWLRNTVGCGVVLSELVSLNSSGEVPDAIGWRNGYTSILIECKTSRSDFLADKKKIFRKHPEMGMGDYRFYLTPPDTVFIKDLPEGWGLLWCYPNLIRCIIPVELRNVDWGYTDLSPFHGNKNCEMTLMYSALRRKNARQKRKSYRNERGERVRPTPKCSGTQKGGDTESLG